MWDGDDHEHGHGGYAIHIGLISTLELVLACRVQLSGPGCLGQSWCA